LLAARPVCANESALPLYAEGKLLELPYYCKAWTGVVVCALCVQPLRAITSEPTLAMAIEFAALLQISRLWVRRTAQDYQQIAVLSFLHLIAARCCRPACRTR
jgi:hypothetical protein